MVDKLGTAEAAWPEAKVLFFSPFYSSLSRVPGLICQNMPSFRNWQHLIRIPLEMLMKTLLKRMAFWLFKVSQRIGIDLLPNHYYSPVADVNYLEKNRQIWAKRSGLVGINVNMKSQIENLRTLIKPFQVEYAGNFAYLEAVTKNYGPGFGYIEAQALHGFLRSTKPKNIIEIGSGVSTYCALKAVKLNERETGQQCKITCIEPYPSEYLRTSNVNLVVNRVEALDVNFFEQLDSGDFLFIDSSHTVRPGGDVTFIYLEVLPRLKPGTYIHIHDIYFPYTYSRDVLKTFFQCSETALLQALMVGNQRISILFCLSLLHYDARDVLKEVFPEYAPQLDRDGLVEDSIRPFFNSKTHFPSSLYLEVRKVQERVARGA